MNRWWRIDEKWGGWHSVEIKFEPNLLTVGELKEALSQYPDNRDIVIRDSAQGECLIESIADMGDVLVLSSVADPNGRGVWLIHEDGTREEKNLLACI